MKLLHTSTALVVALLSLCLLSCSDYVPPAPVVPEPPMIDSIADAGAVAIQVVHGSLLGQEATIDISMYSPESIDWAVSGFFLRISYEQNALSFFGAVEGDFFRECDWEYFTYREGYLNTCEDCPTGTVLLVALADDPVTLRGPDCFKRDTAPGEAQQLVRMHFLIANDSAYACEFLPVSFFWADCEDNNVSSVHGDTINVVRRVYDYTGESAPAPYSLRSNLSEIPGPDGPPNECAEVFVDSEPIRSFDFYNGGIRTECPPPPDFLGDINKNNEPNEVADVLMFASYFAQGYSAFNPHIQESIDVSDINRDGIKLTAADLVLLIQIVVGEGSPWITLEPTFSEYSFRHGVVSVAEELGAAHLVFEGEANITQLATDATMLTGSPDGNTHVLLHLPLSPAPTAGFSGNLVQSDANLLSVEFATFEGQAIIVREKQ